ncbi:hypothetical protein [Acinetobacter colistiniresistens]|uniref:Uncharacterized protein n=1 Tax=Acinetobacter colistiniresistens TaxID=280145 RepID=S3TAM3_9GAMM|nr:hypothetical protein [Acinetobacter colistiniresistens]EPG38586.1 hypothetical protein F907_01171 [Acinetobacter colistiniresistens]TVT82490.1 hypothetical protein FPV60_08815 [Acinetobacter colistiniresistens]
MQKMSLVFFIFSLLFPFTTFANSTEPQESMDIFIGTLTIKDKKATLTRCDSVENEYVLKDADWSKEKAVSSFISKASKLKQPIYAEVIAAYKSEKDTNVLLVDSIENLTEAKSCHLADFF